MSIRNALLALLSRGPATTYQLHSDFESSTEGTWSLNIGQVSSTLDRLSRDELIKRVPSPSDSTNAQARDPWQLTDKGEHALKQWWSTPVTRLSNERHELVIKLAVATAVPGVDVEALIQHQREHSQGALHDLTRIERDLASADLVSRLAVRHQVFAVEAELRWLNDVEGILDRAAYSSATNAGDAASAHAQTDAAANDRIPAHTTAEES